MKKILLSLAVAVCSLGAWATGYNVLKLHLNDGSEVKIVLSEALRLNFTDTHLVATGGQTDVQVEKSSIALFQHLYDPASGVDGNVVSGEVMSRSGNTLQFNGLLQGTVVSVFNAAGTLLTSGTADDGDYTLSLDGYTPGVYIVTAGDISYKIIIR